MHFNEFIKHKLFADAIGAAEEHLMRIQAAGNENMSSADILKAIRLIDEARSTMHILERNLYQLSDVLERLSCLSEERDAQIIETLSRWLDNTQRMKIHGHAGEKSL